MTPIVKYNIFNEAIWAWLEKGFRRIVSQLPLEDLVQHVYKKKIPQSFSRGFFFLV
jgi:hypothetical protein